MNYDLKFAEQSSVVLGDILYLQLTKSKYTPNQIAQILENKKCTKVCFNGSKRMYSLHKMKGKEDWKDVN
jgi:hypothetical protein